MLNGVKKIGELSCCFGGAQLGHTESDYQIAKPVYGGPPRRDRVGHERHRSRLLARPPVWQRDRGCPRASTSGRMAGNGALWRLSASSPPPDSTRPCLLLSLVIQRWLNRRLGTSRGPSGRHCYGGPQCCAAMELLIGNRACVDRDRSRRRTIPCAGPVNGIRARGRVARTLPRSADEHAA